MLDVHAIAAKNYTPRGVMALSLTPFCGTFIVDEKSVICLSIYAEPFPDYPLPIEAGRR